MEDCFFIGGPWAGRCSNLPGAPYHEVAELPSLRVGDFMDDSGETTVEEKRVRYLRHPFRTPEKVWLLYAPEYMDDEMIMSELIHAYTAAKGHGAAQGA